MGKCLDVFCIWDGKSVTLTASGQKVDPSNLYGLDPSGYSGHTIKTLVSVLSVLVQNHQDTLCLYWCRTIRIRSVCTGAEPSRYSLSLLVQYHQTLVSVLSLLEVPVLMTLLSRAGGVCGWLACVSDFPAGFTMTSPAPQVDVGALCDAAPRFNL